MDGLDMLGIGCAKALKFVAAYARYSRETTVAKQHTKCPPTHLASPKETTDEILLHNDVCQNPRETSWSAFQWWKLELKCADTGGGGQRALHVGGVSEGQKGVGNARTWDVPVQGLAQSPAQIMCLFGCSALSSVASRQPNNKFVHRHLQQMCSGFQASLHTSFGKWRQKDDKEGNP